MRKDSWFRGPFLSVLFFALLIGNVPAWAPSASASSPCPPGQTQVFDGAYTCVDLSNQEPVGSHRDLPCSQRRQGVAIAALPVPALPMAGIIAFGAFSLWYLWDCF